MKKIIRHILRNRKEQLMELLLCLLVAIGITMAFLYEPAAIAASVIGVIAAILNFGSL